MESSRPIVVSIQFKVMLNDIPEKLNLPPAKYAHEKFGHDHLPVFVVKIGLKAT